MWNSTINSFRLTAVAFSLILLSACGGGGGGGGGGVTGGGTGMPPPPPPPSLVLPDRVVNMEAARGHLGGDAPPTMTSENIERELASEARANGVTPLFSRVNLASGEKSDVVCTGATCTAPITGRGGSIQFSLERFGQAPQIDDVDLARLNQEYELVMNYRGFNILQSRGVGLNNNRRYEFQGYGGWLDENVFAVQILTLEGADDVEDGVLLLSYSLGNDSGQNPGGTGPAVWRGVMVGATSASPQVAIIQGNAQIDIGDLASPSIDIDVAFTDILNLSTSRRIGDMNWTGLGLTDGVFSGGDDATGSISIEGRFYGTNQGEVGGVFEGDDIVGAFGAERQ